MRRVKVVAALIEAAGRSGRFLVQQRLPGKARSLLWEFPGGKVEEGESEAEALVRECREELAVELEVMGPKLWSGVHDYPDLAVELILYRAEIRQGEPQCLGANALAWLTPAEMKALPFCDADWPLLDALEQLLSAAGPAR